MTACKFSVSCALMIFATGLVAGEATQEKKPEKIVIRITPAMKYVLKGAKVSKPVEVTVGSSVIWMNTDAIKHSAVSDRVDPKSKKPLFDTGTIDPCDDSKPIPFTQEMFTLAGGQPGGTVMIPYYCREHKDNMKGMIKLIDKKN